VSAEVGSFLLGTIPLDALLLIALYTTVTRPTARFSDLGRLGSVEWTSASWD
jgi:hypothetical protein